MVRFGAKMAKGGDGKPAAEKNGWRRSRVTGVATQTEETRVQAR